MLNFVWIVGVVAITICMIMFIIDILIGDKGRKP